MAVRFTRQGCKVETTYIIQPNHTYTEDIVMSVDPGHHLSLVVEERAGRAIDASLTALRLVPGFRR
jgi:hypothetical protein